MGISPINAKYSALLTKSLEANNIITKQQASTQDTFAREAMPPNNIIDKITFEVPVKKYPTETTTLENNLKLTIGKGKNRETTAKLVLTPVGEIQAKTGTKAILRQMLSSTEVNNGAISMADDGSLRFTKDGGNLKEAMQTVLNPNLTQEKLDRAKKETEDFFGEEDMFTLESIESNWGGGEPKEEALKKITLQDIQSYYSNLLNNSEGKMAVIIPEDGDKNEVFEAGRTLPMLKPYSGTKSRAQTAQTAPKTIRIKSDKQGTVETSMFFETGTPTPKESAIFDITGDMFEKCFDKVAPKDADAKSYAVNFSNFGGNKLTCHSYSNGEDGKRKLTPEELQDTMKKAVETLMTSPIDEQDLSISKSKIKLDIIKYMDNEAERKNYLIDNDSNKDVLEGTLEEIDSITSDDIRECAKKYLRTPYMTFLAE